MKKLTFALFIAMLMTAQFMNAQDEPRITIASAGTYTFEYDLTTAVSNATAGDTFYLGGGIFNVSDLEIDKKLHIFGVGHHPDSCAFTGITKISGNVFLVNGAGEGSISGVFINGNLKFGTSEGDQVVNNYTVSRCKIGGELRLAFSSTSASTGIIVEENIVQGYFYGGKCRGNC